MTTYKIILASVALAFATTTSVDAQGRRSNPNHIDNHDRPLDLLKLKLTQLHPNRTAIVVTAAGGENFSGARLRLGEKSPWRIKLEYECPGAGTSENGYFFTLPSEVTRLDFRGYPELWMHDLQHIDQSTSGEIELLYWQNEPEFWEEHHDVLKQEAINACNRSADRIQSENPGYNRKRAMSKVGKIKPFANYPYSQLKGINPRVEGKCVGARYEKIAYNDIQFDSWFTTTGSTTRWWLDLVVDCQAETVEPYNPLGADAFTTEFSVTNVALEAQPKLVVGQCPRDIAFRGRVSGQGEGRVRYRIRGSDGSLSPVRVAHVKSGVEPADVNFTRSFGESTTGGLVTPPPETTSDRPSELSTEPPDPDPAGPRFETTAPEPPTAPEPVTDALATPVADGEHSGWYRIEILSPRNGKRESPEANYKVVCLDPPPDGLSLPPVPSDPPRSQTLQRRN
ncbi:MAG: hypothetical protein AAFX54_03255 [Pseudomonadota bacterium]